MQAPVVVFGLKRCSVGDSLVRFRLYCTWRATRTQWARSQQGHRVTGSSTRAR